jgi:hypothetical protein
MRSCMVSYFDIQVAVAAIQSSTTECVVILAHVRSASLFFLVVCLDAHMQGIFFGVIESIYDQ